MKETMKKLESMLAIMNVEGLSSEAHIFPADDDHFLVDSNGFATDKVVRVMEVYDNFGNWGNIEYIK